jgi:hypothetical protein
MFYREIWMDKRLKFDIKRFRNKTEFALHESYAVENKKKIFLKLIN